MNRQAWAVVVVVAEGVVIETGSWSLGVGVPAVGWIVTRDR